MRIAFVYKEGNPRFQPGRYDGNPYRFFFNHLPRVADVEVSHLCGGEGWDTSQLNDYDAVVLWGVGIDTSTSWAAPSLYGLDKIHKPKMVCAGDPCDMPEKWCNTCRDLGVTHVFKHWPSSMLSRILPDDFTAHHIVCGIDNALHGSAAINGRIDDKVLVPGSDGGSAQNRLRRHVSCFDLCKRLTGDDGWVGDRFPVFLSSYKAGVATGSEYITLKHYELPACGMLSFLEANNDNCAGDTGFEHMKTAVLVRNRVDCESAITNYMKTKNDPMWTSIAEQGRQFTLDTYGGAVQADKMVSTLKGL